MPGTTSIARTPNVERSKRVFVPVFSAAATFPPPGPNRPLNFFCAHASTVWRFLSRRYSSHMSAALSASIFFFRFAFCFNSFLRFSMYLRYRLPADGFVFRVMYTYKSAPTTSSDPNTDPRMISSS